MRPSSDVVGNGDIHNFATGPGNCGCPHFGRPARGVRGLRWWIAALLFFATLINLLDRLTVAVLAPVITTELGLTNLQFASISTSFLVAYAASQALSGRLFDALGTRRGFSLSVLVWSLAAMAHAFARGLLSLGALRFVLGIGEGGNWPGAAKVIAEWFPVRERAFAMAIVNAASALGSIVAPPLVVWLQLQFGWRATFLATGAAGLVWLLVWHRAYATPEEHTAIAGDELAMIQRDRTSANRSRTLRWRELLMYREVWAIVLARFFADPVWWLYLTWLPLYLYNARGFTLRDIGLFAWVPYVAADAGSLTGGWLSGALIARGWTVNRARKAVLIPGTLLMSAGILAARAESPMVALALIGVVLFGFQSWIGNVQTMPSDYFPESVVASVAGLGGLGAGVGAILLTLTTGVVVDRFGSYTPILVVAALLPVVATGVLFLLGGEIHPVEVRRRG